MGFAFFAQLSHKNRKIWQDFPCEAERLTPASRQNSPNILYLNIKILGQCTSFPLTGLECIRRVQLFIRLVLKFNSTSTLSSSYQCKSTETQHLSSPCSFVLWIISGDKFISMTRCLRIRDLEKAEDIVNMFGQKTELRSTRFGVKSREFHAKSN